MSTTRPGDERTQSGGRGLTVTEACDIIRNSRRRHLIDAIAQSEDGIELGDAAERIAAIELGVDESQVSSQQRTRLYIALYQSHLPRLKEHDIVLDTDPITPGENFADALNAVNGLRLSLGLEDEIVKEVSTDE